MRQSGLLFLLLIGLLGCGEQNDANTKAEEFLNVDTRNLKELKGNLQSEVRLQAKSSLLNYKDPLNIQIHGQFLSQDSKVVVTAYTSSLMNNDGSRIEFLPADNKIEVYLFTKDYPKFHFCTIENAMSNNGIFKLGLQLAFLQSTGPAVLIWNRFYNGKNTQKRNFDFFSALNAECNSSNQKIFIDHFGNGRLWGLEVLQTRIHGVNRKEAYYDF